MILKLGRYDDDNAAAIFGQRVKTLREGLSLTQLELAEKCGLGRPYISSIERGKPKVSLVTAKVLAKALKVDLGELVDGL